MPTRAAAVFGDNAMELESAINKRIAELEAHRHNLVVHSLQLIESQTNWHIAAFLYTDEGSIKDAQAAQDASSKVIDDYNRRI
jgi:hypothetical protein